MNRLSTVLAIAIAFPVVATSLCAQEAEWIQDFAKAKEKAKAEKKHLLIDFTGSDWCGWCKKLDAEVFSQAAFVAEAPKHYVLVKLDFPQNEDLITPEIKKQNEELGAKYKVQGYPTILLTDCDGHVFGQTGYQEGGPEAYNTHLAELQKKGEVFLAALGRAEASKGLDRAKALDEALASVDAELVAAHYLDRMEEICTLDADGKGGLKEKYATRLQELKEQQELETLAQELQEKLGEFMQAGEGDKALAALDEVIAKPKHKTHKQLALFFKGMVTMDVKKDAKAAIDLLTEAQKLNPTSPVGQQIGAILPQLQQLLEKDKGKEKDKEGGGK